MGFDISWGKKLQHLKIDQICENSEIFTTNGNEHFLLGFPLKSAQDFPDFRKFPKNPNFEIKISRRLLNGFKFFWMIMKVET